MQGGGEAVKAYVPNDFLIFHFVYNTLYRQRRVALFNKIIHKFEADRTSELSDIHFTGYLVQLLSHSRV